MKSNDLTNRSQARERMMQALRDNNEEAFVQAWDDTTAAIGERVLAEYQDNLSELRADADRSVLAQRGVRQLTSEERNYYQKLVEAMKSSNVRQAISSMDVVLPTTTINAVFDDLQASHPLLSRISFRNTSGITEMYMSENGEQMAQWGKLCDPIVKELLGNFRMVNMTLMKLSAFIPVCKAMLDLGPEWLDSFIRQVLYEALANGLEYGIVAGTGSEQPIGMIRQVGDEVSVTGGVYPEKAQISVTDLQPRTVGHILSLLAVDPAGKPRTLRDIILIVNPQDYFQRVMPATTVMAPDGTYRNDVLPYPMDVVQSLALPVGKAVIGIASKYFAGAGMARNGRIEYSDHYQFLEDDRVYLIKLYANGFPMDNNAFLALDISNLQPAALRVIQMDAPAASTNANLANLRLGALTLSPAFAAGTTTYTAATTNATNTVAAVPADAGATVAITNTHDTSVVDTYDNGAAITWAEGSNKVEITVTAADGTTEKTYTVTVTKS